MTTASRATRVLGVLTLASLAVTAWLALVVSPPDVNQKDAVRLLYLHVPTAWLAMYVSFGITTVASIFYLWRRTRSRFWDLAAGASAEVGVVFCTLTLLTGSIWGRATWGVWWTWDARLTSTAVLLVIFAGYLALRAFAEDPERRARWSAAVGVLGALNVPIVYMSVKWWRTLHQTQSSPSTVDPAYTLGLRANAIAFVLVLIYLVRRRYQSAIAERDAERRRDDAAFLDRSDASPEVARV